jgi:hypothetical protein
MQFKDANGTFVKDGDYILIYWRRTWRIHDETLDGWCIPAAKGRRILCLAAGPAGRRQLHGASARAGIRHLQDRPSHCLGRGEHVERNPPHLPLGTQLSPQRPA